MKKINHSLFLLTLCCLGLTFSGLAAAAPEAAEAAPEELVEAKAEELVVGDWVVTHMGDEERGADAARMAFSFKADGTGVRSRGDREKPFHYVLSEDGKKLTVHGPDEKPEDGDLAFVLELTATTLKLGKVEGGEGDDTITMRREKAE